MNQSKIPFKAHFGRSWVGHTVSFDESVADAGQRSSCNCSVPTGKSYIISALIAFWMVLFRSSLCQILLRKKNKNETRVMLKE